ncbi:Vacuolar protein sorting-associated protein vps5 [Golovinomyces cichoracearum]|uniref:Vacuolar protein sorting-associated protein vps5 n=1 Tax=Golovinomyces cichoracearum TaxID=62708 RepID=A0A420IU52_9PEZI|nr:Vacuolar protein sorting-associated protein vps5 [Golovinomyces cichoracearum]
MDLEEALDSPWHDMPSGASLSKTPKSTALNESIDDPAQKVQDPQLSSRSLKSPSIGGRSHRGVLRRPEIKAIPLDDSLGPLGPLGNDTPNSQPTDLPPAPPQKEEFTSSIYQATQTQQGKSAHEITALNDVSNLTSNPRIPPPVQSPQTEIYRRDTQPSVSVEQAAKPSFDISVGDPHKVGDLTSSHTVYLVRTKTTSKAYRQTEFAVTRRYRDFLWLYSSLHANNPGVVVPPPPEKQAVGRFETNFVESRRSALERMLNKIAGHPSLQHDADLKIFLESESFNMDVKHKERKEPLGERKGMFSGLGIAVGSGGKFVEQDDWFHERRLYLDALENQLKALFKSMDVVVSQRKGLAEAASELSAALNALSSVELSPSLAGPLGGLSDIQTRIKELYDRQAQQDVLTLGITIDEYIRLVGSIKQAFSQRQKAYGAWHLAEQEMQKKKMTHDKLLRQGKSQKDRLVQVNAGVSDAEKKVHQARLQFEDMGRLMKAELERFEKEKVEDFKSAIETFLEGAVEAQKELIEIWETFLMQLDAEDEEESLQGPPIALPGAQPSVLTPKEKSQSQDPSENKPLLSGNNFSVDSDEDASVQYQYQASGEDA